MERAAPISEAVYEASLRQGHVKHALRTALACCLATGLVYFFQVPSGQLAPVFAYLLLSMGMPRPRLNGLLAMVGIAFSAIVSALIVVTFRDALLLYLAVTLLWIFICLLFSSRFPLPSTMGAMVSALGYFVFFDGTVGDALRFYVAYGVNWLIAASSVAVVYTLLWPLNTLKDLEQRLAEVYDHLEQECRRAARQIRLGECPPAPALEWAPFWRLRQILAPYLQRAGDTHDPFASMIRACWALNLRLWFFNRAIAPVAPVLPAEAREHLASHLDRCAQHLHLLLEGALQWKQVPPVDAALLSEVSSARSEGGRDVMLAHGIHVSILRRLVQDIQTATTSHNAICPERLESELVALPPASARTRLLDVQSLRASTKLVIILLLLLVEERWLGFPGGSQVAFFATFFASTGNIGRQNKTDLVGLAGLLIGFAYGVVAAFLTSRLPHFPLLLELVFLGQFLASLAYQRLPRFGAAGLQAGLALPFAYLATTGPEWGSFDTVRTRFAGLVVAAFTAVVVHAYLWPVLPMRRLRASIAAALQATAVSLSQLFGARSRWDGAPPILAETVARGGDLLDDARYLPGPEHTDPAYFGVLGCLQEIDANLEYIHFLVGLEEEHPLRQRFFQVIGDYGEQARTRLEKVARQFQGPPGRAVSMEHVRWEPDVSGRWERESLDAGPRPAVIARCLDQIAREVERISEIAKEINERNYRPI